MSIKILHSWRTLYEWGSRLDESDSKAAIPVYEQALQVAKTGQEKALTLVNLGRCYYLTKEVTKARTAFTD
ncbi:MAG TPA: tetratricopeptide repeat protein, partial [Candidatus Paceibacterota bacterium]